MKNKSWILATLAAAVVATGCNKSSNSAMEDQSTSDTNSLSYTNAKAIATNAWEKTKEATTNAWADLKTTLGSTADYTYDKKDEFTAKASADMDALDQKIKELSDKVANASDSVKTDAQAKLQALTDKRSVLAQKYDAAKNATEANWDDAKTAFKSSYDDAESSLKEDWQWLKDKMS